MPNAKYGAFNLTAPYSHNPNSHTEIYSKYFQLQSCPTTQDVLELCSLSSP